MRVLSISAIFVLCLVSPTQATFTNFVTGDDLLRLCTATDSSSIGLCYGYIEGVADFQSGIRDLRKLDSCLPPGTESHQIRDAVIQYLQKYPASRVYDGASLVAAAIGASWTCPTTPRKSN